MPNRLPLPAELLPLIEKRESADRRAGKERRANLKSGGAAQAQTERRKRRDRRKASRRKSK